MRPGSKQGGKQTPGSSRATRSSTTPRARGTAARARTRRRPRSRRTRPPVPHPGRPRRGGRRAEERRPARHRPSPCHVLPSRCHRWPPPRALGTRASGGPFPPPVRPRGQSVWPRRSRRRRAVLRHRLRRGRSPLRGPRAAGVPVMGARRTGGATRGVLFVCPAVWSPFAGKAASSFVRPDPSGAAPATGTPSSASGVRRPASTPVSTAPHPRAQQIGGVRTFSNPAARPGPGAHSRRDRRHRHARHTHTGGPRPGQEDQRVPVPGPRAASDDQPVTRPERSRHGHGKPRSRWTRPRSLGRRPADRSGTGQRRHPVRWVVPPRLPGRWASAAGPPDAAHERLRGVLALFCTAASTPGHSCVRYRCRAARSVNLLSVS